MNICNSKNNQQVCVQHNHKHPLLTLQQEVDRLMSEFGGWFSTPKLQDQYENLLITPDIDIVDDKSQFKVDAELPGMSEEDVKVSICDDMLCIKGEKSTSKENKDKNYVTREISYGNYERKLSLPESVDTSKAKATFKKGVLSVTIPKKPESIAQARELKIEKA